MDTKKDEIKYKLKIRSPSITLESIMNRLFGDFTEKFENYMFVKEFGIFCEFLYCKLCKKLITAPTGKDVEAIIDRHALKCTNPSITDDSDPLELPFDGKIKSLKILEQLIRDSDSSINFVVVKKSDEIDSVWYYNLFCAVEHNGIRQDFLYCKTCEKLIPYQINEYPTEILKHKCLIDIRNKWVVTDKRNNQTYSVATTSEPLVNMPIVTKNQNNQQTEIIVNEEQNSIFEIRMLEDDENDNDVANDNGEIDVIEVNEDFDKDNENLESTTPLSPSVAPSSPLITLSTLSPPPPLATQEQNQPLQQLNRKRPQSPVIQQRILLSSLKPRKPKADLSEEKLKITQNFINYLVDKRLPIEINDESFQRFAQSLLNAGATFGSFRLKNYWLEKRKVDYNIAKHLSNIRQQISNEIIQSETLSFSCDTWHVQIDKSNNLTLLAHFIDKTFCMDKIVLGTRSIKSSQTGANSVDWFSSTITSILQQYMCGNKRTLTKQRFATILLEEAAGFVTNKNQEQYRTALAPFLNKNILLCSATMLNDIINEEFSKSDELKEITIKIQNYLSENLKTNKSVSAKDLLRKRELNNNYKFEKWNTILNLLILYKNNTNSKPTTNEQEEIQQNVVNALFKILTVLKSGLKCLGDIESTVPTINIVCIVKQKLLSDLRLLDGECMIFESLRLNLCLAIRTEFVMTDLHKIATFLDPRFKELKFLNKMGRLKIKKMVKSLIGNNNDAEVDVYVDMKINYGKNLKVLDFWKNHKELPKLRELVRKILAIPASSNLEACTFSPKAINLIQKRALQRGQTGNSLEIAQIINGNLHLVSFDANC